MSVINEYLKKTDKQFLSFQYEDIPPILKRGKTGSKLKKVVYLIIAAITMSALGLVALHVQPYFNDFNETLFASENSNKVSVLAMPVVVEQITEKSKKTLIQTKHESPITPIVLAEFPTQTQPIKSEIKQQESEKIETKTENKKIKSDLTRSNNKAPININNYYQLGIVAQKKRNYQSAKSFYNGVLAQDSRHIGALTNLAAVYIHEERFVDAEATLAKIRRIEPSNIKAIVNSGIIAFRLKRFEKARELFQRVLTLNPREEIALINLACISKQENDIALTEKYYKRILTISTNNKDVLLAYAALLEQNNRLDQAVTRYRESLDIEEVIQNVSLYNQINERIRILNYYMQKQSKIKE